MTPRGARSPTGHACACESAGQPYYYTSGPPATASHLEITQLTELFQTTWFATSDCVRPYRSIPHMPNSSLAEQSQLDNSPSSEAIPDYYDETLVDYDAWSREGYLHYGYWRPWLNPFRRKPPWAPRSAARD